MSFQINDTTYSGTHSTAFIMQATYGMDTIRKGVVNLKSGIKKKHTIPLMDYQKPLKPRMATPVTNNANPFTIDGRVLIPQSVDIYEEFNPRDLEEHALAEVLSPVIIDRAVPQTVQSQMVQVVLNRAGEAYETGLWQGSLAYAGNVDENDSRYQLQYFNGFIPRMLSDAAVVKIANPVNITNSNIAGILDTMIATATSTNRGLTTSPDKKRLLKFMMSPNSGAIYEQMQRNPTFKGQAFDVGFVPPWGGYKVEILAGMPDNTIVFAIGTDDERSNLWAGVNSSSDWNLKVAKVAENSELYFIQGKMKWDVNYGWGKEIFLYTTLTPNNFLP